jgi:hypothetical protein
MRDDFEAEDFCTIVFDEFFFTSINSDNVVRHLMRLLWFVHPKVSANRLDNLIKLTEPVAASAATAAAIAHASTTFNLAQDTITKAHAELKEKIDAHVASVAASTTEEDNKSESII